MFYIITKPYLNDKFKKYIYFMCFRIELCDFLVYYLKNKLNMEGIENDEKIIYVCNKLDVNILYSFEEYHCIL